MFILTFGEERRIAELARGVAQILTLLDTPPPLSPPADTRGLHDTFCTVTLGHLIPTTHMHHCMWRQHANIQLVKYKSIVN